MSFFRIFRRAAFWMKKSELKPVWIYSNKFDLLVPQERKTEPSLCCLIRTQTSASFGQVIVGSFDPSNVSSPNLVILFWLKN
jgi:hypothetical protein